MYKVGFINLLTSGNLHTIHLTADKRKKESKEKGT